MRLVFILGPRLSTGGHGDIDPGVLFTPQHRALTGSEHTFFLVARTLAERGHEVTVYCDAIAVGPGVPALGGATVRHINEPLLADGDAYVSLSEPDYLRRAPTGSLRICWQQHNNFDYAAKGYDDYVTLYAALSPVHRTHLIERTKTPADKWIWIPNCIDTTMFPDDRAHTQLAPPFTSGGTTVTTTLVGKATPRDHSAAWISSPDRGLHRLLEIWPAVRARVPDATLRIYYRFDPWIREQLAQPRASRASARAAFLVECLRRLGRNGENGVTVVGAVPNVQLIEALRKTRVLPYTCECVAFTEGFGVAVLDACAAGVYPLISDADALGDIYRDVAGVIHGKPQDRRDQWVDAIVRAMIDDALTEAVTDRARTWALSFSRERIAAFWEHVFTRDLGRLPATVRNIATVCAPPTGAPAPAPAPVPDGGGKRGVYTSLAATAPVPAPRRNLTIDYVMNQESVLPRYGTRAFDVERLFDAPRGLSGTDINFFGSAFAMARRGHKVRIFAPFIVEAKIAPFLITAVSNDVECLQYGRFATAEPADVSIAHYDVAALGPSRAKLNVGVQHTISIPSPEFTASGRIGIHLSPTRVNRAHLQQTYVPGGVWDVLPNANDMGTLQPRAVIPGRMIFHTSPERGLHLLLRALPVIRSRVPDAHVLFIGDLSHLDYYLGLGGKHAEIANEIRLRIQQLNPYITFLPRASRNTVLAELARAAVFAYPSDPPIPCEVFPISVLDALRVGVPTVCMPADGIEDVFGDAVDFVPDLHAFIEATVRVLQNPASAVGQVDRGRAFAAAHTFDRQAAALEEILLRSPVLALPAAPVSVPSQAPQGAPLPPPRVRNPGAPLVSVTVAMSRPGGVDITMAALRDQTLMDYELVVVDNRYERRRLPMRQMANEYGVPLVHAPEHRRNGKWIVAVAGYNTAFALARGKYVIMLHDFTYVPPNWLEVMVAELERGPKRLVVGDHMNVDLPPLALDVAENGETDRAIVDEDLNFERFGGRELSIFERGLFHPSWMPLPVSDKQWQPQFSGRFARGERPDKTWITLTNDGIDREFLYELGGVDERFDLGRGPWDVNLGYRIAAAGGTFAWVDEPKAMILNPRFAMRSKPFGDHAARVAGRWSMEDARAYNDLVERELRTRAGNPYDLAALARQLEPWRDPETVREPQELSDLAYWRRQLRPEDP